MQPERLAEASRLFKAGRFDEAAQSCRVLLAHDPSSPEANHLLGLICYNQGKNTDARDLLTRATASSRATGRMYSNLGAVLNTIGETERAVAAYRRALDLEPDNPWALNNLGVLYRNSGRAGPAVEVFKKALVLKPDFADAQINLRLTYAALVPQWHFAMMNDSLRNDAYEAAIRRAVAGKRVLDIGTGAGLLALMAAAAGAENVVSCEAQSVIAQRAAEIVAQNRLADRVRVIAKRSTELVVGRDLPDRAEVLITETFSSNVLDEGILPVIEHAHRHLLVSGAVVIPAAASAMGFLIGGKVLREMLFAERIKNFEMSTFNEFAPPRLVVSLDSIPHEVLSEDFELLRFDLTNREFPMSGRKLGIPVTRAGICFGVAQWIRLELDEHTQYRNRPVPHGHNTHWPNIVYRFPQPVAIKPGDLVRIVARHNRSEINVDFAGL